jgi:hypothetical protein
MESKNLMVLLAMIELTGGKPSTKAGSTAEMGRLRRDESRSNPSQ